MTTRKFWSSLIVCAVASIFVGATICIYTGSIMYAILTWVAAELILFSLLVGKALQDERRI